MTLSFRMRITKSLQSISVAQCVELLLSASSCTELIIADTAELPYHSCLFAFCRYLKSRAARLCTSRKSWIHCLRNFCPFCSVVINCWRVHRADAARRNRACGRTTEICWRDFDDARQARDASCGSERSRTAIRRGSESALAQTFMRCCGNGRVFLASVILYDLLQRRVSE